MGIILGLFPVESTEISRMHYILQQNIQKFSIACERSCKNRFTCMRCIRSPDMDSMPKSLSNPKRVQTLPIDLPNSLNCHTFVHFGLQLFCMWDTARLVLHCQEEARHSSIYYWIWHGSPFPARSINSTENMLHFHCPWTLHIIAAGYGQCNYTVKRADYCQRQVVKDFYYLMMSSRRRFTLSTARTYMMRLLNKYRNSR